MQDFDVGERFHGPDLANRSLNGAYVFYDGRPFYITMKSGRDYDGILWKIGDMKAPLKTIDVQKDMLLDMSSPVLGWINSPNGDCHYIARRAARQWKQGLSEEHCSAFSITGEMWNRCGRSMFQTQDFVDMLLEKYPKYLDVEKSMIESPFFICKAFSQNFAVCKKRLWFKSNPVGTFKDETKEWEIIPEFLTPTSRDYLEFLGLRLT